MKAKMASEDKTGGARAATAAPTEVFRDYEDLPRLARLTVETFVREHRVLSAPPVPADSPLKQPSACFVSIKLDDGDLRGCIGTIEPTRSMLVEELRANAISAATRDPRFSPVTVNELPRLRFSVDVLSSPETARMEDLNPAIYGVIVTDDREQRRGLLLPAIEGIETVAQQVTIAARKAGLRLDEVQRLYRFRVQRFNEQPNQAKPSTRSNEHGG
jgi:AmmeMemoRadiSam system protein A